MRESGLSDIELQDTPIEAFDHLLKYIYTGQMTLRDLKDEIILEILGLAHQYGFTVREITKKGLSRLNKALFSIGPGTGDIRLPPGNSERPQCVPHLRHGLLVPTGATHQCLLLLHGQTCHGHN